MKPNSITQEILDIKEEAHVQAELLGHSLEWEDGFLSGWILKENHDNLIKVIKIVNII